MPQTFQNVHKDDAKPSQGAEGKSSFQIFKWVWALVFILINVNDGFQILP